MKTLYLNILLLGLGLAFAVTGLRYIFKQPIHRNLFHLAKSLGSTLLFRTRCRRLLLISSASAAKDLFTTKDKVFANRPKLIPAKVFGCNYTNLAWAPDGPHWRHLRATCHEMLPFDPLPYQHDSLAAEVKRLLRQLYGKNKDPVKLQPMFQELVFNVMMRMFAGTSYWEKKMMEEGEEKMSILLREYASRSFKMTTGEPDLEYFMPILKSEYFMPILKSLGLECDLEQRCTQLRTNGDKLMQKLIDEIKHQKEESVVKFLLDRQKSQNEDPILYSDETIKGLVCELLSAGTDTSAVTLEWAFSLLLNHPEVLQKAQNEIDNRVGNERFLEQSDIDHLPYLSCIVKETMRLYPAAPLLVPRESLEDCKVGEYNVPKETMLMVNAWAIHHDPETWKEPSKFNPERFEDVVDKGEEFKLMPFGHGMRICPGKQTAMRLITLALGSLIHCFNWERFPREEMVDMTEQTGLALFKAKPLMAVCRPRSKMDNLLSQI